MTEVEQVKKDEKLEERTDPKEEAVGPMDSNYPLWQEFREKAPGTHKHTQILEGMVENVQAAADIKSDALRMGTKYHDIGKLMAAQLYSENQGKDNPHDGLEPWVSYHLITRHVSDSVMILIANDFPRDVIKIVSQHHGNCILQSIYERAKAKDKNVAEELFRYKTERPACLESLILMLCDQVEATSRSIYVEQNMDIDPSVFVSNIYNKLHYDGQFDDVQVRLGKLKRIQAALIADVASNFQKRIKYAEDDELVTTKE
jgi:putative nucleotidyltransferase with HDIG domain